MSDDLNGVPSGLGFNCFMLLISQLAVSGYQCQSVDFGGLNWIKMTKRGGFVAYFDDWADVFNFNDSCASVIAMYEKEEEEASNNE